MATGNVKFTGYSVKKIMLEQRIEKTKFIKKTDEMEGKLDITSSILQNKETKGLYCLNLFIRTITTRKNIELEIEGYFEVGDTFDEETVEYFLKVNAPAILYPYARTIISSVTTFDSSDAVILPVINFAIQHHDD